MVYGDYMHVIHNQSKLNGTKVFVDSLDNRVFGFQYRNNIRAILVLSHADVESG
jgi:predicted transcriptional regulator